MSTIIETLQCAEINMANVAKIGVTILPLAQEQLHTAVTLLEKGYGIEEDVDKLVAAHGSVDNVPDQLP